MGETFNVYANQEPGQQLDDRFIFDKKKVQTSSAQGGGSSGTNPTPQPARESPALLSTTSNPDRSDLSNQFIESMVHLGISDGASIRSLPSHAKNKKRNLFGFNLKNRKRYDDEKAGDKFGRYLSGDPSKGSVRCRLESR
ncbi:hypothetical protein L0F63_005196 [Massospora cicadina]|nr:hypothetical protein L0F63_005196 [Massospora cicadina]